MESIVKYEPPVDALLALGEVPFAGKWMDYEAYGLHRAHIPALVQLDADGKPVYRADGKVLKSDLFSPPDLRSIIQGVSK